jgi:hypothetical protein
MAYPKFLTDRMAQERKTENQKDRKERLLERKKQKPADIGADDNERSFKKKERQSKAPSSSSGRMLSYGVGYTPDPDAGAKAARFKEIQESRRG